MQLEVVVAGVAQEVIGARGRGQGDVELHRRPAGVAEAVARAHAGEDLVIDLEVGDPLQLAGAIADVAGDAHRAERA